MPRNVKLSSKVPFDIENLKAGKEYMEQMKYVHQMWQPDDTLKDLNTAIKMCYKALRRDKLQEASKAQSLADPGTHLPISQRNNPDSP